MKTLPRPRAAAPASDLASLRRRLAEAEGTLLAIQRGEVDVVVVTKKKGLKLFTLEGAGEAYRALIESMNEGALTLAADQTILYSNQCFARMVKCPLEQVIGGSLQRFLAALDQTALRVALHPKAGPGKKLQLQLHAADGALLPVQISFRRSAQDARISAVVTDLTAARRSERELRALSQRVTQVQEAERGRVAAELHDHITQRLCAAQFSSQALADCLPPRAAPARREARKLRDLLGGVVKEVERIAHNLRPSVLDQLGLSAALRAACTEFSDRTGLALKLNCESLSPRLSPDSELALYRILQVALKNVEQHARATVLSVSLAPHGAVARLVIEDDGVGFDPLAHAAKSKGKSGFGLLGMRERAGYVGGALTLKSAPKAGTRIEVSTPLLRAGQAKAGSQIR